jgi:hypothetical protein
MRTVFALSGNWTHPLENVTLETSPNPSPPWGARKWPPGRAMTLEGSSSEVMNMYRT